MTTPNKYQQYLAKTDDGRQSTHYEDCWKVHDRRAIGEAARLSDALKEANGRAERLELDLRCQGVIAKVAIDRAERLERERDDFKRESEHRLTVICDEAQGYFNELNELRAALAALPADRTQEGKRDD